MHEESSAHVCGQDETEIVKSKWQRDADSISLTKIDNDACIINESQLVW